MVDIYDDTLSAVLYIYNGGCGLGVYIQDTNHTDVLWVIFSDVIVNIYYNVLTYIKVDRLIMTILCQVTPAVSLIPVMRMETVAELIPVWLLPPLLLRCLLCLLSLSLEELLQHWPS